MIKRVQVLWGLHALFYINTKSFMSNVGLKSFTLASKNYNSCVLLCFSNCQLLGVFGSTPTFIVES